MSSGVLRVLEGGQGQEVAAVRFHRGPITAIHLFPAHPLSQYEADVWVIYQASSVAISVPYYRLVASQGSKEADEPLPYTCYDLSEHENFADLALFSRQPRLLDAYSQQVHKDRCFFITCGSGPMLGFYALGGDGGYYRGLGELVSAVRRRITSAVVGTVGSLLPWNYLRGNNKKETDPYAPRQKAAAEVPVTLSAEVKLLDGRRRTQSIVLDPSERLAAVTDAMGRVLLVDLWTRTVIRLWKGHRDAQCSWLEVMEQWPGQMEGEPQITETAAASMAGSSPRKGESMLSSLALGLYLVIYSPQRSLVELWRMRHGGCVKTIAVPFGPRSGARLVTVYGSRTAGFFRLTRCFLVRRGSRGDGQGSVQVDMVTLEEADIGEAVRMRARGSRKEDFFFLKQFRDMLAQFVDMPPAETRRRSASAEAEQALLDLVHKIKSPYCLHQMMTLLDDEKSGAARFGPSFHKQATLLCVDCYLGDEERMGSKYWAMTRWLKARTRLLEAYELVYSTKPDVLDSMAGPTSAPGNMKESVAWVNLAASKERQTASEAALAAFRSQYDVPISIPAFVKECGWDVKSNKAVFRTHPMAVERTVRSHVVNYLMRPLLCDVFAIKALDEMAEHLGWDGHDMMAVLAEWFLNLPLQVVLRLTTEDCKVASSPLLRYLDDQLGKESFVDQDESGEGPSYHYDQRSGSLSDSEDGANNVLISDHGDGLLDPVYRMCMETTQLEQAMVLAVMCEELVRSRAEMAESRTYGKISSTGAGTRWRRLTRQLRVALVLSNRLGLKGESRDDVSALDVGSSSLYGMLASDLLSLSSSPKDCIRIENACSASQHLRWTPNLPMVSEDDRKDEGVEAWSSMADERWRVLLDAAAASGSTASKWPLLLFFTWHNQPKLLGCHRAKILTSLWAMEPGKTSKLSLARDHLGEVAMEDPILAGAVGAELWLSVVGPKLWDWLVEGPSHTGLLRPPVFLRERVVAEGFLAASLGVLGFVERCQAMIRSGGYEEGDGTLAAQGLPTPIGEIWPNTEDRWTFEAKRKVERGGLTEWGISMQVTLLKLLHVMVVARIWDVAPSDLFLPGTVLGGPNCLTIKADDDKEGAAPPSKEGTLLAERRRALVVRALNLLSREGSHTVYSWAEAVGMAPDEVRREHVVALLTQGHDILAEDLISQVSGREQVDLLAKAVIQLLRSRLSGMVRELQKAAYARVLAAVDADTCQWVVSCEPPPSAASLTSEGGESDDTVASSPPSSQPQRVSLTGTHNVLIKLIGIIAPGTQSFRQAQALATLTSALLTALQPPSFSSPPTASTSAASSIPGTPRRPSPSS